MIFSDNAVDPCAAIVPLPVCDTCQKPYARLEVDMAEKS